MIFITLFKNNIAEKGHLKKVFDHRIPRDEVFYRKNTSGKLLIYLKREIIFISKVSFKFSIHIFHKIQVNSIIIFVINLNFIP